MSTKEKNKKVKKSGEEKIMEWFGEWSKRRIEKWGKMTKMWFLIVVTMMFLGLLNPAPLMTVIVYYMFGAVTTLWLIRVAEDEKLTIGKKK